MKSTNQLIGCCGLDCEKCDARIATITNDNALREKTAALWTQIRPHTVLEDFPLFCPKCKYTCVIRFKDGKTEEIKMPDA